MSNPSDTLLIDDTPNPAKRGPVVEAIGSIIYSIRWLLVPMYLLLWVALIAYNFRYAQEILHFLFEHDATGWHMRANDETAYLLWILSLIDITMIGNLVVMTTVGGYSTFVKEFHLKEKFGMPVWMNRLDSNSLKIKMGTSLIGVSAIHLLKTFMETGERIVHLYHKAEVSGVANWGAVGILVVGATLQIIIHVVFIGTTLAFTKNAILMHKAH